MRTKGIKVYFTIDAGPNVHLICRSKDVIKIKALLLKDLQIKKIIINRFATRRIYCFYKL